MPCFRCTTASAAGRKMACRRARSWPSSGSPLPDCCAPPAKVGHTTPLHTQHCRTHNVIRTKNMHHVIIGGGPAATNAIETIRQFDGGASTITLISDEPAHSRMALPYWLSGNIPAAHTYTGDA